MGLKCVGWELEKLLGVGCPSSPSQDRAAEQLRGLWDTGSQCQLLSGPMAQHHPGRADSFRLASLNPAMWALGAPAMQERLCSFLSPPNSRQQLKNICNECDVLLGLQVSGPCCMLKGDSGGLGVGNVAR